MALPATHIRFAAALSGHLSVADMAAYFSGTLYPDSRWLTGLDRQQTHGRRFLDPQFPADDFTLGWHVHCAADRIQAQIHAELLADLAELDSEARWIRVSAAKAVQDRSDAASGELEAPLALLRDIRTPNGESAQGVDTYFDLVRRVYSRRNKPRWSDYAELWAGVGLDREKIGMIAAQVERILADAALRDRLHGTCDRMLHLFVHGGVLTNPDNRETG